jgi:hypothetical protein
MNSVEEAEQLVEKSNWTSKALVYLKNVKITEYDLKDGGLSVITEYNLLTPDVIAKLKAIEKEKRNIVIGKLQAKYPKLSEEMVVGFKEARKAFVIRNSISSDKILSIKKDALFIINGINVQEQITPNLLFRGKNMYSSYLNLNKREFYFSPFNQDLDIKGLSEDVISKQSEYLLKSIKTFMRLAEKVQKDVLFDTLKDFQAKYLSKELDPEYYRNLDTGKFLFGEYEMDECFADWKGTLDISYNYINYVLPMIKQLLLLN